MTLRVAVIGCGPAGLAAAHAAVGLGAEVEVLAPWRKTPQRGPLLIQRPIPGINTGHPDGTIHQIVIGGSILDYRYKLYGDINIGINGNILQPYYHAWRHGETYDRLWAMYHNLVNDRLLTPKEITELVGERDLVVSTASAKALCTRRHFGPGSHRFVSAPVAITPHCQYPDQPDNTIIFNAWPDVPWVRSSRIFGNEVTEWPGDIEPATVGDTGTDPSDIRIIQKPINTDCNCYPLVLRTGRFGAWRNETWIDTAYWDTYSAVVGLVRRPELEEIR